MVGSFNIWANFKKYEGGANNMAELEIRRAKLKKLMFNKYDANEVEACLESMYRRFHKLQLENVELIEKVKELTGKLDSFREKEESIQNALAMAEKVSSLCIKEARVKAEKILSDAKLKSSEMMANTNCEAIEQKDNLIKLRSYVSNYQKGMLLLFKDHLDSLKKFISKDSAYQEFSSEIETELSEKKLSGEHKIQGEATDISNDTENNNEPVPEQKNTGRNLPLKANVSKISEKFKDLKFGKNYTVNVPQKRSFFNVFKKVSN